MTLVRDVTGCSTATVAGLSRQIIAEMNLLIPGGVLVEFSSLNIEPAGAAVTTFLQPAAKEALRLVLRERPNVTLHITSAYRTVAQQFLLFRQFQHGQCSITAAARPGKSNHEDGLALDTPDFDAWRHAFQLHGWTWLGPGDRVHFTFTDGGTRDDVGNIGVRAFQHLWNRHNPTDRITEDGEFGPQTQSRLERSPAEGFASPRILHLVEASAQEEKEERLPALSGEDVIRIQEALRNSGEKLSVDGEFGPETEKAVRSFQERNGLLVDGIIGIVTRRELGIAA